MIRTPEDFEPELQLELHDDAIAHVFVRDALVQNLDEPRALPWRSWRAMGFRAARVAAEKIVVVDTVFGEERGQAGAVMAPHSSDEAIEQVLEHGTMLPQVTTMLARGDPHDPHPPRLRARARSRSA